MRVHAARSRPLTAGRGPRAPARLIGPAAHERPPAPDRDLRTRRERTAAARVDRRDAPGGARAALDAARGVRVHRRRGRDRDDDAQQPRGVRPLADRPARAARRVRARHERRAVRAAPRRPVPARSDRRAGDGPSPGRPRGRPRRGRRGHPDDHVQPGVAADGGRQRRARLDAALVPALLEHVGRAGREPRRTRRARGRGGDRRHARHDDPRLAHARPRRRLPAVPARQGDRAVHERPGVPAADPGPVGWRRLADADADPRARCGR